MSSTEPLVSVVTPLFNRAHLLQRAWASMRNQDVPFEWIVVDDGSHDDPEPVVRDLGDARIVWVPLERNRGANAARNAGADISRGAYVVFVDSDDELVPGVLARMVEVMETAGRDVGAAFFRCVPAVTGGGPPGRAAATVLDRGALILEHLTGDRIGVYRREVFARARLPEDLRGCEYVFLCDVSRDWRVALCEETGLLVHRQGDNLSGAASIIRRSLDMAVSHERIVETHAQVFAKSPDARVQYLERAMYRYGIAHRRRKVLSCWARAARAASWSRWPRLALLALVSLVGSHALERRRLERAWQTR